MNAGIAKISKYTALLGDGTGATDLLTASLNQVTKMAVARIMTKVMSVVNTVHPYSHPLFLSVLFMTWSENRQWIPDFIASNIESELGVPSADLLPDWDNHILLI